MESGFATGVDELAQKRDHHIVGKPFAVHLGLDQNAAQVFAGLPAAFGDRQIDQFVECRERFAHLEELVVSGNYLTRAGLAKLEKLGPRIISNDRNVGRARWACNEFGQREIDEALDEDEPDDAYRYAAIYE